MANCGKVWVTTSGLTDTPMDWAMRNARAALLGNDKVFAEDKWVIPHLYVEEEAKAYICHGKKSVTEIIKETIKQAEKEKEKNEMGEKILNMKDQKGDIIWRVDSIKVERDTLSRDIVPRVDIEARLIGIPKTSGYYNTAKMRTELQDALDNRSGAPKAPAIKKVIFNNPATIILWADGTKTVVKRQKGDRWDPEKGFAMAYLKKMLGNDNTFNKEVHKWVKEETTNEN